MQVRNINDTLNIVTLFPGNAASSDQSFKAPFPIPEVGSSNPHQCIVFEHMQADVKTADSA